jgi:capsular polysaccharide transport system ATP-binding protein
MIIFESVSKLLTFHQERVVVLENLDWYIAPSSKISIIAQHGAGKTTLLDLICGMQAPTFGKIDRRAMISPTKGFSRHAIGRTTIRQLARRFATLFHTEPDELVDFIRGCGVLHDKIDRPVRELRKQHRQEFELAMFYGLPFDFYLFDDRLAVGGLERRRHWRAIFERRRDSAGMILVTSHVTMARDLGGIGGHLHRGKLTLFPTVDQAVEVFEHTMKVDSLPPPPMRMAVPADDDAAVEF